MTKEEKNKIKSEFLQQVQSFAETLKEYVSTPDNQWTIKGFIDVFERIYTISNDTKIVSKVLEIQLFAKFLEFSEQLWLQLSFSGKTKLVS